MKHLDKYILIALVIVVLFILMRMNKVMAMQTTLMMGMAHKMGVVPVEDTARQRVEVQNPNPKANEETKEETEQILKVAEKIYYNKNLTKKDKDFQKDFEKEINEEVNFLLEDDLKKISKEITAKTEITQEDADLYKDNFDEFKDKLELAELTNDVKIKEEDDNSGSSSNVVSPENDEERKKLMLTFFEDGIPKVIGKLAVLYADKTGLVASTGNTAKILDKLLAEERLKNQKILHDKRNKVFYGLPDWFEKNKLKKEYAKNIV